MESFLSIIIAADLFSKFNRNLHTSIPKKMLTMDNNVMVSNVNDHS